MTEHTKVRLQCIFIATPFVTFVPSCFFDTLIRSVLLVESGFLIIDADDNFVSLSASTGGVLPTQEEEHDVRCDEAAADVENDDAVSEDVARCVFGAILRKLMSHVFNEGDRQAGW